MSGLRRIRSVCWSGGSLLLCALMFGIGALLLILSLPPSLAWKVVPPGWYLGTYGWGSLSASLSPWGVTVGVGSHFFGQYGYGLCAVPFLLGAMTGAGLWWWRKRAGRIAGFAVIQGQDDKRHSRPAESMRAVDAAL